LKISKSLAGTITIILGKMLRCEGEVPRSWDDDRTDE